MEQKAIKIQRAVRAWLAARRLRPRVQTNSAATAAAAAAEAAALAEMVMDADGNMVKSHRVYAREEILQAEQTYLNNLRTLIKVSRGPSRAALVLLAHLTHALSTSSIYFAAVYAHLLTAFCSHTQVYLIPISCTSHFTLSALIFLLN